MSALTKTAREKGIDRYYPSHDYEDVTEIQRAKANAYTIGYCEGAKQVATLIKEAVDNSICAENEQMAINTILEETLEDK